MACADGHQLTPGTASSGRTDSMGSRLVYHWDTTDGSCPRNSAAGDSGWPNQPPSNALSPSLEARHRAVQFCWVIPERNPDVWRGRTFAEGVPKPAARSRTTAVANRHHAGKLDATSTRTGGTESPPELSLTRSNPRHRRGSRCRASRSRNKLFDTTSGLRNNSTPPVAQVVHAANGPN